MDTALPVRTVVQTQAAALSHGAGMDAALPTRTAVQTRAADITSPLTSRTAGLSLKTVTTIHQLYLNKGLPRWL